MSSGGTGRGQLGKHYLCLQGITTAVHAAGRGRIHSVNKKSVQAEAWRVPYISVPLPLSSPSPLLFLISFFFEPSSPTTKCLAYYLPDEDHGERRAQPPVTYSLYPPDLKSFSQVSVRSWMHFFFYCS